MGIENAFLRDLPGVMFWLAGLLAQFYLIRVLSIPRSVWRVAVCCQLLIFLSNTTPFDIWLHATGTFLGSLALLWWWSIIPLAIGVWLRRKFASKPFNSGRRAVLQNSITAISALPAIALGVGIITRKDLTVHEISLKFPNLPKDLQGLRLVQLSDIHMGTFYSAADLRRAVDAANGLRADLMFVTGDLITDRFDPLDQCLLELKRLRAASGLWGCLGNHEMHSNAERYTAANARRLGLRFLRGEREALRFGDAKLNLVGVDHQVRSHGYLLHTANLVQPDAFNLLLSHNPSVFPIAERQGFQLQVSGHTHGGQINLELLGNNINVADLITPFTKGTYHINSSSLYVNSGLGTIGVPVRLGSPPEVTLITLCNS